jgi:hypothetical protein
MFERALTLEPDYAGAHGYLAWCHQILFVYGGFNKESHDAAIRHGRLMNSATPESLLSNVHQRCARQPLRPLIC